LEFHSTGGHSTYPAGGQFVTQMKLFHTHQERFLLFNGVEHWDSGHCIFRIVSPIQTPIQSRSVELAIFTAFGQRSFLVHLNIIAIVLSVYSIISPAAKTRDEHK
jgi:hypothetical protein